METPEQPELSLAERRARSAASLQRMAAEREAKAAAKAAKKAAMGDQ
jgi:hypothetical protein